MTLPRYSATSRHDYLPCVPYRDRCGDWVRHEDAEAEVDAVRRDVCGVFGGVIGAIAFMLPGIRAEIEELMATAAKEIAERGIEEESA